MVVEALGRGRRVSGVGPSMARSSPRPSTRAPERASGRRRSRRSGRIPCGAARRRRGSSSRPRACVAARHRIGISSIAAATSAGPRSIARSSLDRTVRSASGSPTPSSSGRRRSRVSSIRAPIRRSRSTTARRVGFTPTPRSVELRVRVDRPGDEPERGRGHVGRDPFVDGSHAYPSLDTPGRPRPSLDRLVRDRHPARPEHPLGVIAGGDRLANRRPAVGPQPRQQDRRLHLGARDGVVTSIARSGVRPTTVSGGRESFRRAWSTAPIERSGSMIRATGRRRNERSPSRTWNAARPARIPADSRRRRPRVPAVEDAVRLDEPVDPGRDDPVVDPPAVAADALHDDAEPPDQGGGRPDVGPSPAPSIRLSPSASAARRSARWLIDLSPGSPGSPRRRAAGRIATGPPSPGASRRRGDRDRRRGRLRERWSRLVRSMLRSSRRP